MNIALFRSKMILYGDNQRKLADVMNVTEQTIGDKLYNDKWKQSEITTLKKRWCLTPAEIDAMFFTDDSDNSPEN